MSMLSNIRGRRLPHLKLASLLLATAWSTGCGESGTEPGENGMPAAVGVIPAEAVTAGGPGPRSATTRPESPPSRRVGLRPSFTVDVGPYFADPDGDRLAFSATSSDPSVARASAAAGTVAVTVAGAGAATITVIATDPGGLAARQTFRIQVAGGVRGSTRTVQAAAAAVSARTYGTGETIATLPTGLWMPDAIDGATFVIVITPGTLAAGGHVTIFFERNGYIVKDGVRYTCVTAGGCRIDARTVGQGSIQSTGGGDGTNRAPETVGTIPGRTMTAGQSATLDVSSYFRDPDGDRLTYSASSSSSGVARASVSGSSVRIEAVGQGTATVRITATDPGGLTARQSFAVTVQGGGGGGAGGSFGSAIPLAMGDSASGAVQSGGELYYEIDVPPETGRQAVRLTVWTEGTSDTQGRLYGADTLEIGRDDDGGPATNFLIAHEGGPGKYYVKVQGFGGAAARYALKADDHGDGPETATRVAPGAGETPGRLHVAGNVDYFRIAATASARRIVAETTGSTDTYGQLLDGDGNVVTQNDDGGQGSNFKIDREVDPGTYYIRVTGFQNRETGPYVLAVAATGGGGAAPDLVVESPSVSDASPAAGASFTLSATVRNQGGAQSASTTLRYYRSSNATISSSDQEVGTDAVGGLAASGTSAESVNLTAPTTAGTYYYGACVETVAGESDGDNNCSSAVTVTVGGDSGSGGSNQSPVTKGSIPARTLAPGGAATVDASGYFSDPEGDELTYTVSSANTGVATASVSGDTVTVAGVAEGSATIRITATDAGGLSAVQTFSVTVRESADCTSDLGTVRDGMTVRRTGFWDGSCPSVARSADHSARYYSFTLSERLPVSIDLTSSPVDTWLALRRGAGTGGDIIESDNDSGTGANARIIDRTLGAGTYSIEATTYRDETTGPFTLTLTVGDDFRIDLVLASSVTANQEAAFRSAAERWMTILAATELSNYEARRWSCPGDDDRRFQLHAAIDDVMIVAAVGEIDGPRGTLGVAGPCWIRTASGLPIYGRMEFDAADLERMEQGGYLEEVVLHEMGHVLGFGSLWSHHELLQNPTEEEVEEVLDTHFTGPLAIAAFDDAGGTGYGGAKVPVENTGGRGTRNSHWRETVMQTELMTGWTEGGGEPLSAITIQSLADLGYAVDVTAADPYRLPDMDAIRAKGRLIPYGDDIWRGPINVADSAGRVVRVSRPR